VRGSSHLLFDSKMLWFLRDKLRLRGRVAATVQKPHTGHCARTLRHELVFGRKPGQACTNRFQFVPTPVTSTSFIHMRMDTRMKSSCSRSSNARDILDSRSRPLHDAYANHKWESIFMRGTSFQTWNQNK
jgi:hypothetical protein